MSKTDIMHQGFSSEQDRGTATIERIGHVAAVVAAAVVIFAALYYVVLYLGSA
jgi:hypothetical protein